MKWMVFRPRFCTCTGPATTWAYQDTRKVFLHKKPMKMNMQFVALQQPDFYFFSYTKMHQPKARCLKFSSTSPGFLCSGVTTPRMGGHVFTTGLRRENNILQDHMACPRRHYKETQHNIESG